MPGFVQIVRPGGEPEAHPLDADQVTIGRGPEASIALPEAASLEPQHLLLVPRPRGCWVSVARSAAVVPRVDGRPLEDGELPWGVEIHLGDLRLRLSEKRPAAGAGARPVLLLLLVVVLGLVTLASMQGDAGAAAEGPPLEPSPLFDPVERCDAPDGAALHRAREALHAARAGEERYPFEARDGVGAVGLYREAAACFAAEGLTQQSVDVHGRGERLAERIEEDYRTLRLALSRQLGAGRTDGALRTTRSLRALLRHRSDAYARWLAELERRLVLALDQIVQTE